MTTFVLQPERKRTYLELLDAALARGEYTDSFGAFAYAMKSGVKTLNDWCARRHGDRWTGLRKRWLVGIDLCRSDPDALEALSNVRIPDGDRTVRSKRCKPKRSFHPKVVILSGPKAIAAIVGSGNLSWTGLSYGCECGGVTIATRPFTNAVERKQWHELRNLLKQFHGMWELSTPAGLILERYRDRCAEEANLRSPVVTIEDVLEPVQSPLSPAQIVQLRSSKNFWIEAGILGANLKARNKPGNQLDMSPMMRAFFGFPARRSEPNEKIGWVELIYGGKPFPRQPLRFDDNGMDKMSIPSPSQGGPKPRPGMTLLFQKLSKGRFLMSAGLRKERLQWRAHSEEIGAAYKMTRKGSRPRPREWGLF
jgi:hypothetical protein